MTFTYYYKTSDGIRHEADISAANREEVFSQLRSRGIRPIKVIAGDGSKANGEIREGWKRWIAIVVLAAALVGAVAYIVANEARQNAAVSTAKADRTKRTGGIIESQVVAVEFGDRVAKPRARKQLAAGFLEKLDLAATFAHPAEAYLVRFAQPGRVFALPERIIDAALADDFRDALEDDIIIRKDDPAEVADLKRIVAGIKEEAKMLVASGKSFDEVVKYFTAQQEMEAKYRENILGGKGSKAEKAKLLDALGLEKVE